jgi:hypothetical protein
MRPDALTMTGTSLVEAARRAGITYRQADYWCRCGYVPGVDLHGGSGNARAITTSQARHLGRLARLVQAGIKVDVAAAALAEHEPDATLIPLSPHVIVRLM